MRSKITVLNQVPKKLKPGDWNLCFQWCQYFYDNGTNEFGFRFIWRDEKNNLRPQRGQARIPSKIEMEKLLDEAKKDGWL